MQTSYTTKTPPIMSTASTERLLYSRKSLIPEWQQDLIEKKFIAIHNDIGVIGDTTSLWDMFLSNLLSIKLVHMADCSKMIKVTFNKKLDRGRY